MKEWSRSAGNARECLETRVYIFACAMLVPLICIVAFAGVSLDVHGSAVCQDFDVSSANGCRRIEAKSDNSIRPSANGGIDH